MVRPNRIKEMTFGLGSLTASSTGSLDVTFGEVKNGTIQKIAFKGGNWNANGSITIQTSGQTANETIFTKVGALQTDATWYPFVYPVNSANTTGSPQAFTQRVVNSHIRITGHALGTGSAASGLTLYYI